MNRKGLHIFTHMGCWLLFIFLIAAFLNNSNGNSNNWLQTIFSLPFLLFVIFYVVVFYLNLYVLMPYLFLKKKYTVYTFTAVALLAICFYIKPFEQVMQHARGNTGMQIRPNEMTNRSMPPPPHITKENRPAPPLPRTPMNRPPAEAKQVRIDIISLVLFFMVMAGSAMLVLSKQWRITEKNKALVEVQKAKAELAFLKAQISPHFLFNVLNNIYALVITKNDNAASGILRLSNIMRYVTDDARADFVPVEKEIACINDFIALQKLRSGKNVKVNYTVTGAYGNITVAPLILMAFVENTFKHGISNNLPAEINIDISVKGSTIHLKTQNAIFKKKHPETRDGVGLQNVVQRLELLYPGRHQLHINTENDIFKVVLVLQNAII
ncbi:MAG: histidine kinase [Niabella sp.]